MNSIRIIGDIHGKTNLYFRAIRGAEQSIQIGDLDFNYDFLKDVYPYANKFFGGNHDNYVILSKMEVPHDLGDFGLYTWSTMTCPIFWVRGGWSIDRQFRTPHVDWWENEQLSQRELNKAVQLYAAERPAVVLSHECPLSVVPFVTNPAFAKAFGYDEPVIRTRTNVALEEMLIYSRPQVWIFGHYHFQF